MAGPSFPRPYINDAKQDDTFMHYVRDGDMSMTDIGSGKAGMPASAKSERMTIDHVGGSIGSPNWGGK